MDWAGQDVFFLDKWRRRMFAQPIKSILHIKVDKTNPKTIITISQSNICPFFSFLRRYNIFPYVIH